MVDKEHCQGLVMEWDDPAGASQIVIYADGVSLGGVSATGAHHAIFLNFDEPTPAGYFTLGAQAIYADGCQSEIVEVEVYYDDVNENENKNDNKSKKDQAPKPQKPYLFW